MKVLIKVLFLIPLLLLLVEGNAGSVIVNNDNLVPVNNEIETHSCILYLRNGNIKQAKNAFDRIDPDYRFEALEQIVDEVYDKDVENSLVLLKFFKEIDESYRRWGYSLLYRAMAFHNHLNSYPSIIFLHDFKETCTEEEEDVIIKNVLSMAVDGLVYNLRNDNDLNKNYILIAEEMPEALGEIYERFDEFARLKFEGFEKNSSKMLSYIDQFEHGLLAVGLNVFWKDVTVEHPDTIKLAFLAKSTLDSKYFSTLSDDLQAEMEILNDSLPEAARLIIWGTVCLKNVRYNEYLYADPTHSHKDGGNFVFTWAQDDPPVVLLKWKFETSDKGSTFHVKNSIMGHSIFVINELSQTRLYVKKDIQESSKFTITPLAKVSQISFWNTKFDEGVCSSTSTKFDMYRRYVATKTPGVTQFPPEMYWNITNCSTL